MPGIVRVGDVSNHGGTVISGSTTTFVNGLAVTRQGDLHSCPIRGHHITPFTSNCQETVDGKPIVRAGIDACGCGAIIPVGSPNTNAQ